MKEHVRADTMQMASRIVLYSPEISQARTSASP